MIEKLPRSEGRTLGFVVTGVVDNPTTTCSCPR